MKKIVFCTLIMFSLSLAQTQNGDIELYKKGVIDGIKIGRKFEEMRIKSKLLSYKKLIDAVFDYKIHYFMGELPPYLFTYKLDIKKDKTGELEAIYKLVVLPPTSFPVTFIENLKESLKPKIRVFPPGFIVYEKTTNYPLDKIAYHYYLATILSLNPYYDEKNDMLIFTSFSRKADAYYLKEKLERNGIKAKVLYTKEGILIDGEEKDKDIVKLIKDLTRKLIEKEREALYVKVKGKDLIETIKSLILTARDLANKIQDETFKKYLLIEDLNKIYINLEKYLKYRHQDRQLLSEIKSEINKSNIEKKEQKNKKYTKKEIKKQDTNLTLKEAEEILDKFLKEK